MDFMTVASDPVFPIYAAIFIVIGILIGWIFTRRGWRRRLNEADERMDSMQAAHRRELRERDEQGESSEVVDQLTAQVEELETSLKAAEDELETLRTQAQEAESELATLRTQADEAPAPEAPPIPVEETSVPEPVEVDEAVPDTHEAEELRSQLSLLQQEYDDATQNAASDLAKARNEAETAAAALIAVETELAAAREDAETARREADTLRTQIEEGGAGTQKKEIALNEAYEHAAAVQNQLKACQEEVTAARGNLKEMKERVNALEATKEELEVRVQQSRTDVAGDLAVLTSTMLKIKDDALNEANARIAQLTEEVDRLRVQGK